MSSAAPELSPRGVERGLIGTILVSALLHAAAIGVLIAMPDRFLSAPPRIQSYTVDLVAPDVIGGTNLLPGGGAKKPAPAKVEPIGAEPIPAEPASAPALPPAPAAEPVAKAEVPPPAPVEPVKPVEAPKPVPPPPAAAEPPKPAPPPPKPVEAKPEAKPVEPEPPPKPVEAKKPELPKPAAEAPKPKPVAEAKPPPKPEPPVAQPKPVEKPPVAQKPAAQKPAEAAAKPAKPEAKAEAKPKPAPPVPPAKSVAAAPKVDTKPPAKPVDPAADRDDAINAAIQKRAAEANQKDAGAKATDQRIAAAVQKRAEQLAKGGSGAAGVGGPIATGPGTGVGGTPTDMQYVLYEGRMRERIKNAWAWTGANRSLIVIVQFNITPEGEIRNVRTIQSSGDTSYDASAERAVRAVNPLERVPEKYRDAFATVELTFRASDLES